MAVASDLHIRPSELHLDAYLECSTPSDNTSGYVCGYAYMGGKMHEELVWYTSSHVQLLELLLEAAEHRARAHKYVGAHVLLEQ